MRLFSSTLLDILKRVGGRAIQARTIARLYLDSGTWGASDNASNFTWGGQEYLGFDANFGISVAARSEDGREQPGSLSLSSTVPAVVETFLEEAYRAKAVQGSILLLDPASPRPEDALGEIPILDGRLDVPSFEDAAAKAPLDGAPGKGEAGTPSSTTLTVTVQPLSADLDLKNGRIASQSDQHFYRDPDDDFFQDITRAGTVSLAFGQPLGTGDAPAYSYGGGGAWRGGGPGGVFQ